MSERLAVCTDCGKVVESTDMLPFFCATPEKEMDHYYCGCMGAD